MERKIRGRRPSQRASAKFAILALVVAQIYVVATRDDDGPRTEVLGESFGNLQVMKASHTPAGGLAGGSTAKVAADGEFVAYESNSSGIVAGDTNGRTDVFLYSTARNTNERVSLGNAPASAQGNGDSKDPIRVVGRSLRRVLVMG